jgi:iron(III) transport system substrate-binding protein
MMLSRRSLLLSLASAPLAAMGLWGCNSCRSSSAQEVVVYTSVDQVFSEPVFRAFEAESGLRVRAVYDTEETKSTGVLNRLIAEAQNPQADVFWSGDPHSLSRVTRERGRGEV